MSENRHEMIKKRHKRNTKRFTMTIERHKTITRKCGDTNGQ